MKLIGTWLVLAFMAGSSLLRAADSIETRLQQGLFEEEGNHNLEAAKKNYEAVLGEYDRARKFAGTALFHLAQCLRKEGKTNEARPYIERIVSEFSHETEFVKWAREALGEKGVAGGDFNSKAAEIQVDVEKASEDGEIERITRLLRESPDLINASRTGKGSLLHDAAMRNYTRVVEFLLTKGADASREDGIAISPLEYGVRQGNKEMVSSLLNGGANVRGFKANGPSPLFQAVESGNKEMVALLLSKGADPEFGSGSERPLHLAAKMGFKAIAQELINHQADVNASDGGSTPLQVAAYSGNTVMAEFLLSKGARIDERVGGISPLLAAARAHPPATVDLLLKNGANINDKDAGSNSVLHICLLEPDNPSNETLKLLLTKGADVRARNLQGLSPLWTAIAARRLDALPLLIHAGADPNETLPQPKDGPSSPMRFKRPVEPGQTSFIDLRPEGQAPLYQAAEWDDYEMAKILLQNRADPNLRSGAHFHPPLAAVIHRPATQIMSLLLEHQANPNERIEGDATVLDYLETHKASLIRSQRGGDADMLNNNITVLKAYGAVENLPRPNAIAVRVPGEPLRTVFTRQGTNDQNRYTLLEAIHQQTTASDLQFPDFHHVALRRANGNKLEESKFDLEMELTNSACPGSALLQWGDVIDIPEAPHAMDASWQGFYSNAELRVFTNCLSRVVDIRIPSQSQKVALNPGGRSAAIDQKSGQTVGWRFESFNPRLQSLLKRSSLPLSGADLRRIKVTRQFPGETEPRVIECNLADHPDGPDNLWLRDGDIVEIGRKD